MNELGRLEGGELDRDDFVIEKFLVGFNSFLIFLQYFGVILIDDLIDLGIWGDVFSWVKIFSIFDLDFDPSPIGLFLIVVSVFFFPITIIIMLKYFLTKPPFDCKFGRKEMRIVKTFTVFLLVSIVVTFTILIADKKDIAVILIILSVYTSLGFLFFLSIKGIVNKTLVIISLRSLLLLCYVPFVSMAFSIAFLVLNKDEVDDLTSKSYMISVFFLPLQLFYMMSFELKLLLISRGIKCCCITRGYLSCMCFTEEQKAYIKDHITTTVRPEVWYYSIYIILERLFIAIFIGVSKVLFSSSVLEAQEDEDDIETALFLSIGLIFVLYLSVLLFGFYKPFKTKQQNIIEIVSRFSHFLILVIFIVFLTPKYVIAENDVFDNSTEIVEEGIDKVQQTLLFLVSIPTFIFWIIILDPYKFYKALRNKTSNLVSSINDAKVKMKWFDVENGHDVISLRNSAMDVIVTKNEWKALDNKHKLLVISAVEDSDESVDQYQGKNFHFYTYEDLVVRYGAAALQNIETFDLSSANLSNNNLKLIGETGILAALPSVTSLDISKNHEFSENALDNFLTLITGTSEIKHLNLSDCGITASEANAIAKFITECTSLESLDLSLNRLMTKGAEEVIAAAVESNTLVCLNIAHNYISVLSEGVTIEVFKSQINQLFLENNCMADEAVIEFISRIPSANISKLSITPQISTEVLEHLDANGEVKTSEDSMQRWLQRSRFIGMKKPSALVINEMLKVFETIPNISFKSNRENRSAVKFKQGRITAFTRRIKVKEGNDLYLESLSNCLDVEKNFNFDQGIITGFSQTLLEQVKEGHCCYLSAALLNLSDDLKAQVSDFINDIHGKNTIILELVLAHGISHVAHCAEILVKLGFDIDQKSTDVSKTLLEMALEHNHDDVIAWANKVSI